MSQRPGSHLDVYLVEPWQKPWSADLDVAITQAGWAAGMEPGPARRRLVGGGYRGIRVERHDRITLFANRQGGFRVVCPACRTDLASDFSRIWSERRDPAAALSCRCGHTPPLADLHYLPDAAFGRLAVVLLDAATFDVASDEVRSVLPNARIIGSRR